MSSTRKPSSSRPKGTSSLGGTPKSAASQPLKTPVGQPLKSSRPVSQPVKPQSTVSRPSANKTAHSGVKTTSNLVTRQQLHQANQKKLQRQRNYFTMAVLGGIALIIAVIVFTNLPQSAPSSTATSCPDVKYDAIPPADPSLKITGKPKDMGQCLKYFDLKVGTGQTVKANDTVTANYSGWLTDGTKFDSSFDRGQPVQFSLDPHGQQTVIAGWQKGLVGMKVGGFRRLIIPGNLGYGARGSPQGGIPPNATLIFDVSLVSIP